MTIAELLGLANKDPDKMTTAEFIGLVNKDHNKWTMKRPPSKLMSPYGGYAPWTKDERKITKIEFTGDNVLMIYTKEGDPISLPAIIATSDGIAINICATHLVTEQISPKRGGGYKKVRKIGALIMKLCNEEAEEEQREAVRQCKEERKHQFLDKLTRDYANKKVTKFELGDSTLEIHFDDGQILNCVMQDPEGVSAFYINDTSI